MPISWSLDDHPHFEFFRTEHYVVPGLQNARSVFQNWVDEFTYFRKHNDWGILTYTFHPHVVGRGYRMLALEDLIGQLRAGGAKFVTMETAVAEYQKKFPSGLSLRGQ